jgi:aldehyde dehydrogenase (NAD+)
VDKAVKAARKAFDKGDWTRKMSARERGRCIAKLADLIDKNKEELAALETLDNGKPLKDSQTADLPLTIDCYRYYSGWADKIEGKTIPVNGPYFCYTRHEPVGVVGQIIPWNFPLLMLAWKIAPALASGNTVVLKPAEFTPLTALAFAGLCQEAGLPAGVVNIVTGDGSTGEALVNHPNIDKIAFTGSTEVGRVIRAATASTHKRLSLELGGKSPFIVFDDADLDSAVEGLVDGIWFNQGQVCCAGSRLLMQESIAEVLLSKIRDRMSTLRIGPPLDKAIDIGAIVARVQLERIQRMVTQGVEEGATCWQPQTVLPSRGFYFPPTILSNVHPTSIVAQQEIFGPVLAAMTFRTPKEAVELANNTVYGLASCVWSENINVALQVAAQIKAGVVWVNCTNLFDAACGFGGYRESGYGREGGREGLLEYMELKWFKHASKLTAAPTAALPEEDAASNAPSIDRTIKLYIGGKQARPDSGYSMEVRSRDGHLLGEASLGNRKDIRNAVEAARKAEGWGRTTAHNRAQVLYYYAENLSLRRDEVAHRLAAAVGEQQAARELESGIERIFSYAAWADKFDGAVHNPPFRNVAIAMNEPIGTVGVICPLETPLLGFISLIMPLLAVGNTVIAVPSEKYPLITADLYQLFDTSDMPAGAVNIVTGYVSQLLKTLAEHDDVDAIWCYGDEATTASAKAMSTGNLKRVWTNEGRVIDWFDPKVAEGRWFLEHATQVKNIWVPYGE